jgi:hypothetical protein
MKRLEWILAVGLLLGGVARADEPAPAPDFQPWTKLGNGMETEEGFWPLHRDKKKTKFWIEIPANHLNKEFLRSCRARIEPADVGLRGPCKRRSPGLRREDVAALAGVSVTWYTWLEQGRDINVSADVLERIAASLRLSHDEREFLFSLVHGRPAPRTSESEDEHCDAIHCRNLVL